MNIVISQKDKFNIFSNIFRHLPLFMETVNINVSDKGIYVQGMDTGQVCLFELVFKSDWFDSFITYKNYVIGIHCATFYKVIQCIEDQEQKMTLYYDDGDLLKVSLEGDNKVNKYFSLPLIDIDSETMDIPETEYEVDMEILSTSITNYINQLMIFDETFSIQCTQEKIRMKSQSDSGNLSIEMTEDNVLMYAIEEELELQQNFSLKYVKNMCAFSKITDSVIINIKNDTPMRFHQSLDDREDFNESENYLRFYIAPKIDEY